MKVGIVVPYTWSFWGGVQEHADHQARCLAALGHEAKILMGHDPDKAVSRRALANPAALDWFIDHARAPH